MDGDTGTKTHIIIVAILQREISERFLILIRNKNKQRLKTKLKSE